MNCIVCGNKLLSVYCRGRKDSESKLVFESLESFRYCIVCDKIFEIKTKMEEVK